MRGRPSFRRDAGPTSGGEPPLQARCAGTLPNRLERANPCWQSSTTLVQQEASAYDLEILLVRAPTPLRRDVSWILAWYEARRIPLLGLNRPQAVSPAATSTTTPRTGRAKRPDATAAVAAATMCCGASAARQRRQRSCARRAKSRAASALAPPARARARRAAQATCDEARLRRNRWGLQLGARLMGGVSPPPSVDRRCDEDSRCILACVVAHGVAKSASI